MEAIDPEQLLFVVWQEVGEDIGPELKRMCLAKGINAKARMKEWMKIEEELGGPEGH